jgi:hypothetical protein
MCAASAMASDAKEEFSPFYIPATPAVVMQRPRVLKQGDAFAILDDFGNAQATGPSPEGYFFEDTRYLSRLLLTIDGFRPLLLSSFVKDDNRELWVDLTNPDLVVVDGIALVKNSIHILSTTVLGNDVLFRNLALRN